MTVELTAIQHKLLNKIAEDRGFTNYEIHTYSASGKGDNYLGYLLGITIKGNDKKLELIAKLCPQNEDFRNSLKLRDVFLKEIRMYESLLANYAEFQEEMGVINPFKSYPTFYGKSDSEFSECLILENLVKNGFRHWNRKLPMNSEHISLVLSNFGRYHAVSFAMKRRNSKLFDDLAAHLKHLPTNHDQNALENFIKNATRTIQKAIKGHASLEKAFNEFLPNISHYFAKELREDDEKMVITHGDSWCNNIMFKYEDSNDKEKPTEVSFIDWQLSRYSLPLLDIAHFFCSASPRDILDDYKKYLKIYHDSFSQNLKEMCCDPDDILTFNELEKMWSKCAKFGFLLSGFIFKILLIDTENAANTQQNTKSVENFFEQFDITGIENEMNRRIVDLCSFLVENKFL